MVRLSCAHCGVLLAEEARACDRCGAPIIGATGATETVPDGFVLYDDAWRGFRLHRPADWRVTYPSPGAVRFSAPDKQAALELASLPPNPVADATQQARLWLRGLGEHEARVVDGARPEQATVLFRTPRLHGRIRVRLAPQGGHVAIAWRTPDSALDLDALATRVFGSLAAVRPIPREPFQGAPEGAFHLLAPKGWQVMAGFRVDGFQRFPMCRVLANPTGQVVVAHEPEFHMFVHRPDEAPRPAAQGFFASLGRFARQLDGAMAGAMGNVMPFDGLRPVTERYFLPRWRQGAPQVELLDFEDHGNPRRADLRLKLPNDVVQVVRVEGTPFPDPSGVPRWIATLAFFYQAPAEVMDRFEPILRGIAESHRIDPQWQQRDQQRFQQALAQDNQQFYANLRQNQQVQNQLHAARMHDIQQMGAASTAMHENNMAAHDALAAGWQSRSDSMDRMQHDSINAIRERTDYVAPNDPTVYNVSSHFERVWTDNQGHFVGGDWGTELPDWTELRRKD